MGMYTDDMALCQCGHSRKVHGEICGTIDADGEPDCDCPGFTSMFEGVVIGRRDQLPPSDEILTQDERYVDQDGYPVRVTSGVSVSTCPDGTVQMFQWDGMVSSPRGRIEFGPDAAG